jgi:RNA polymerase sigma-B factor
MRNIVARSICDERELWRRRRAGDEAAREALVAIYLPVARRLAKRYAGVREPYDDLLQVASLGLLNAIDRYDPDAGTPFVGYARPTIIGELKRHLRDRVWTVRVPRVLHDRLAEIEAAVDALTEERGRTPSVGEIAAAVGLDADDVLEAIVADTNRRPVSLDAPFSDGEETSPRIESLGDEERGYARVEDRAAVAAAMEGLDEREREALHRRFVEERTQRQIAELMGTSQMTVSRLLRRSLATLREEAGP